jgi:hypothetical protein
MPGPENPHRCFSPTIPGLPSNTVFTPRAAVAPGAPVLIVSEAGPETFEPVSAYSEQSLNPGADQCRLNHV